MGCCGWSKVTKAPTVPDLTSPGDLRHLVAHRRARAEVALMEATGGEALCRPSTPESPAAKGAEGRLAALTELQRAVRRTGLDPSGLVADQLEQWRARRSGITADDPAWRAYHEGGIAELEALAEDLSTHPAGVAR